MGEVINLKGKKKIKKIEVEEHIADIPEATFTIEFDDEDKMIIELSLLGEITQHVSDELEKMQDKILKKDVLDILALLLTMSVDHKEIEKFFRELK